MLKVKLVTGGKLKKANLRMKNEGKPSWKQNYLSKL